MFKIKHLYFEKMYKKSTHDKGQTLKNIEIVKKYNYNVIR